MKTYERRTFGPSTVDALGEPVAGAMTVTSIKSRAGLQPMRGHEILTLPEGQRAPALFKVYTPSPVEPGDQVVSGTVLFVVTAVFPYSRTTKAILKKLDGVSP